MKKVILIFFFTIFFVGCSPIQKNNIDNIIKTGVESKLTLFDQYRSGYKYYLPKGLTICDYNGFNEVIRSNNSTYYLYIDTVSYYNRVIIDYKENRKAYYSKAINFEDKFGYLEINKLNQKKYLIEIMYNYAKIEVIVAEPDIKVATANAINILTSVKFNDKIIANQMGDDINLFNESEYNIFKTKSSESTYLYYTENDQYKDDTHDSDLID